MATNTPHASQAAKAHGSVAFGFEAVHEEVARNFTERGERRGPARCGLPLPDMMDKGLLTLIQRARLEQPGGQRQLEDTACCLRSSAAHVRQSLQLFVTGCCNGLLLIGSGRLRKLSPSQSSRIASYCPSLACPRSSTKVHEA
jgi:hypothetical protein